MLHVLHAVFVCACVQERFEYIRSELLPFLKSVGFKEQALQWLPAVGPAGQNLNAPPTEPLLSSWWKGPTLVDAIDAFVPKPRNTGVWRWRGSWRPQPVGNDLWKLWAVCSTWT